jgi:tetratricopeptide (TPR) repeat protein
MTQQPQPTLTPAPTGNPWARAQGLCAAAALLTFAVVAWNGYCYDSVEIVRDSPLVHDAGRWLDVWTTDYWYQGADKTPNRDLLYRPVAVLSYRIVATVAGAGATPQHLVNIALHALVCVLIVQLGRRLDLSAGAATAAGLVFAVLPIHTEVVADVVGRAELLATAGVLTALLLHHRARTTAAATQAALLRVAAFAALFLAMSAKESGVAGAGILVAADAWWHWRARRDLASGAGWWRGQTLGRLMPMLAAAGLYFVLRYVALDGQLHAAPAVSKSVNVLVDAPAWQRAMGVVQLWGMYWVKTVNPRVLCIDYSVNAVRLATSVMDAYVLAGIAAMALLGWASVRQWKAGRRHVALLSAAIVLAYLPASNALVLVQVFFAERIWYLPSVFVAMLAGLAWAARPRRGAWRALAVVLLVAMAGRSAIRATEWHDNGVLFASAYRDHPEAVGVKMSFGQWLADAGRYEEGVTLLTQALEVDPGLTDAHRALGVIHMRADDPAAALEHLRIAQQQAPHPQYEALLQEAVDRTAAGAEEQLAALRAAAEAGGVEAEIGYVAALLDFARTDEALARLAAGEAKFAGIAAWQRQYAVALVMAGRMDEAIARYRQCHAMAAQDAGVLVELAALLMERRGADDLAEADDLSRRAVELAPQSAGPLVIRAEVLALQGKVGEAIAIYERLIAAAPADSEAHRQWTGRAKALGWRGP